MQYGRPEHIVQSLLQKVHAEPSPRADKLESIVSFALAITIYTMKGVVLRRNCAASVNKTAIELKTAISSVT